MLKVENKRMTAARTHAVMTFNNQALKDCGMPPGKDYVVVYEDGKITIAKELKAVEVNSSSDKLTYELGKKVD